MTHENVLTEQGRIVGIEDDALWLDMAKQSTCGACVARSGCGQHLLNKLGRSSMLLKVAKTTADIRHYQPGDMVKVAIADDVVVKSSLIVYLLPLLLLLVFSGIAHIFLASELLTITCAMIGFSAGVLIIKWHSSRVSKDHRFQPMLVNDSVVVQAVSSAGNRVV